MLWRCEWTTGSWIAPQKLCHVTWKPHRMCADGILFHKFRLLLSNFSHFQSIMERRCVRFVREIVPILAWVRFMPCIHCNYGNTFPEAINRNSFAEKNKFKFENVSISCQTVYRNVFRQIFHQLRVLHTAENPPSGRVFHLAKWKHQKFTIVINSLSQRKQHASNTTAAYKSRLTATIYDMHELMHLTHSWFLHIRPRSGYQHDKGSISVGVDR